MLSPVTIRIAHETDLIALERLAQRDTRPLPSGALLVAERGGVIDAALSLDTGESIADPFRRTAELVELLRAQARARGLRPRRRTGGRRLAPRLAGGST